MAEYLKECNLTHTEAIFVAGGDGTVNEVVNAMMEMCCQIPVGVIPAGTDNDFAKTLGFDDGLEENLKALAEMNVMAVDVANANGRYFVNICSAGTLASLTNVSSEMKNSFGRLAYYIKGIGAISKLHKMQLRIKVDDQAYEGTFVMFMVINARLRRKDNAEIRQNLTDGKYDLIAVKIGGIANIARVLMKIAKREPIDEKDIWYVRGERFEILELDSESGADEVHAVPSEIDGELGPELPLKIQVHKGALKFFVKL